MAHAIGAAAFAENSLAGVPFADPIAPDIGALELPAAYQATDGPRLSARRERVRIEVLAHEVLHGLSGLGFPHAHAQYLLQLLVRPSRRNDIAGTLSRSCAPSGAALTGDELRAAIRAELASRAAPLGVRLFAALPRNDVPVHQLAAVHTVADGRIRSSVIQVDARVPEHVSASPSFHTRNAVQAGGPGALEASRVPNTGPSRRGVKHKSGSGSAKGCEQLPRQPLSVSCAPSAAGSSVVVLPLQSSDIYTPRLAAASPAPNRTCLWQGGSYNC